MLGETLFVCAIMAILSVDVRTIGGTMLSRPLVVAPLMGLLLGDLRTGFMVAYFIELVWVGLLPVGAYQPAEALPVTVIATYLSVIFIREKAFSEAVILFCIMVSIPFGFVSRWLETHIRELNSTMTEKLEDQFSGERLPDVALVQYMNIGLSLLKIFLICFAPIYFGHRVLGRIYGSLPLEVTSSLLVAFYVVPLVGMAVVLEIFLVKKYTVHYLASFVLAFVLFYVFRMSPFILMALGIITGLVILKFFDKEKGIV